MKRWGLLLGGLVGCGLVAAVGSVFRFQQRQVAVQAAFPAPDFTLRDMQGRPHRLADFRGKVVFLNVWATWCPPCRMEMPSMEQLHRRFQGKDFVILAVSEDEDGAAVVQRFIDDLGLTFPVLMDPEGIVPGRYGVTGYPETFVIDRDGRVVQRFIGPEDWNSEASYQYFARLLDPGQGNTTRAAGERAATGGGRPRRTSALARG